MSGIGSIGTAINLIATIVCLRCQGMTLGKMPLFAWLILVMAGMVILAVSPLTAAQVMLLIDRYLGGHFFDTQAGGSATIWMHFFWIFGHPEVYVLVLPAFGFASEIIPVFSRKAIFGYPVMVGATVCIGFIGMSVWAHHMFTVGMTSHANMFFVLSTMAIAVPTGIKIFNWLATMWGGTIEFTTPMLFCVAFLFQFLVAGLTGIMLSAAPLRLAAWQLLFRRRPLSLRHRRRHSLHDVRRLLLLVPESHGPHVQRGAGTPALLAVRHRIPPDVRLHACARPARHAATDLHLRSGPRLGDVESHRDHRRRLSGGRHSRVPRQPGPLVPQRGAGGQRPLGRVDARVVNRVAAAGIQLRRASRREEPAAALGSQAPGRSRLEVRVTKGRVAMYCLIAAEAAMFTIFVVAYLFYAGKSVGGPTPKDVLHAPIFFSICLLSSSVTIHRAVQSWKRGRMRAFAGWWLGTIGLGAAFLAGTALEWRDLIYAKA